MSDKVTATAAPTRPAHEEGQFAAVCVDVIDLGQRVEQYQDKPPRVVHKCALVFRTNSAGETKDVSLEVTVSMDKKASLRQFLEKWRGKSYSQEQAAAGVPLDKLEGQAALLTIEHKTSRNDRVYARIIGVVQLPKEMTPPTANGYERGEFWAARRKAYNEEAAKFLAQKAVPDDPSFPEQPDDLDDDLPF